MSFPSQIESWFEAKGWRPFEFQREVSVAWRLGQSGLVHAPTGFGKTLAAMLGPLSSAAEGDEDGALPAAFQVLWITPMRALANDTAHTLQQFVEELGLNWTVALRTSDTSSSQRAKQKQRLPTVLVTTPESFAMLQTYSGWEQRFRAVNTVVVDEWHELLGNKRGVHTELCLTRLRAVQPDLRIWGLSATLGNVQEALDVLLAGKSEDARIIKGDHSKRIEIETLIPTSIEHFPWSGHLGIKLVEAVWERVMQAGTSLIFTNTRSQAEIWHQTLRAHVGEVADNQLAVHHGSLEKEVRLAVEARLKAGSVKAVVCTSSLDLGVDFTPVDRVFQIGSPKGIARLTQRAGRSGHRPGEVSRVIGVPTNALELIEFAAARDALSRGEIESRIPLMKPLDLLVQHVCNAVVAGEVAAERLFQEAQSTWAFRDLTEEEWSWVIEFATQGGKALQAYPAYKKLALENGVLRFQDCKQHTQQRFNMGTIVADSEITVKLQRGGVLGGVEEGFVARLRPGESFVFAGRLLELVRIQGLVAHVRPAKRKKGAVPSWQGGKSPLSSELSTAVARCMEEHLHDSVNPVPELAAVSPILDIQRSWSEIPRMDRLLVEITKIRGEVHCACFTFAGRLVNEGLAALMAFRLGRERDVAIRTTVNDYGISLQHTAVDDPWPERTHCLFETDALLDDLESSIHAAELAKRQFRGIARVAGLILQGFGKHQKSARQVQISSSLLYDVFEKYDPDNLLYRQARLEVMQLQLELTRLQTTLDRLNSIPDQIHFTPRLTPMAFPLWADQIGGSVSTLSRDEQVLRMLQELEDAI